MACVHDSPLAYTNTLLLVTTPSKACVANMQLVLCTSGIDLTGPTGTSEVMMNPHPACVCTPVSKRHSSPATTAIILKNVDGLSLLTNQKRGKSGEIRETKGETARAGERRKSCNFFKLLHSVFPRPLRKQHDRTQQQNPNQTCTLLLLFSIPCTHVRQTDRSRQKNSCCHETRHFGTDKKKNEKNETHTGISHRITERASSPSTVIVDGSGYKKRLVGRPG